MGLCQRFSWQISKMVHITHHFLSCFLDEARWKPGTCPEWSSWSLRSLLARSARIPPRQSWRSRASRTEEPGPTERIYLMRAVTKQATKFNEIILNKWPTLWTARRQSRIFRLYMHVPNEASLKHKIHYYFISLVILRCKDISYAPLKNGTFYIQVLILGR